MRDFVFINGDVVPRAGAKISAFDRGFLYGDGLFETIRAYGGRPFLLAEHLGRMANSAAELGIPMPDREGVAAAVGELVERNGLGDAYIRITLSRGAHTGRLIPEVPPEPTLVIEARPLSPYPRVLYETGATLVVSSVVHDAASRLRRHKTLNYLPSILAKREASERGADEAVLLDGAGCVAEGATSNVFCVRDGTLWTPPLEMNILPGITRATVIRLAGEAGVAVEEARLSPPDLQAAEEVFLTNSLVEVLPVRRVEGSDVRAAPGPVTRCLAEAYRGLVAHAATA